MLDPNFTIHSLISYTEGNVWSTDYAQTYCKQTVGGSSRGEYYRAQGGSKYKLQWQKILFCQHLAQGGSKYKLQWQNILLWEHLAQGGSKYKLKWQKNIIL
jgi:hypothetical protein